MPLTRRLSSKSLIKQSTSQDLANGAYQTITKDTFTAAGVGPYSLSVFPASINNTQVYVAGVYQLKTSYTLSNNQITFGVAPPAGTTIEVISGSAYIIGTPSNGAVNTPQLAAPVAAALNPPGTILAYAGSSAPTGYLLCNGASYSTTTYATLFAIIGYTYGGSGANFNVPDARGIFLRGVGSQTISGKTYTGTLGVKQQDAYPAHDHGGGNHTHTFPLSFNDAAGSAAADGNTNNTSGTTGASGTIIAVNGSGNETQPANLAITYIIKT